MTRFCNVAVTATLSPALSTTWVEDEFFSNALACRDSGALPYESFVGGRDTSFANVKTGGLGKAISTTGQPGTWTGTCCASAPWTTRCGTTSAT